MVVKANLPDGHDLRLGGELRQAVVIMKDMDLREAAIKYLRNGHTYRDTAKTLCYLDRSPERREEFMEAMSQIPKRRVVYVDETDMNEYFYRQHAWSPKGRPVLSRVRGYRFKRLGLVAGQYCGKLVSPWVYDGHMNSRRFEWWFAEKLLPALSAGAVVVLDNAAFHNKHRLRELAAMRQITVIFLPPYSPDLNPIEYTWHWLKDWVRGHIVFHDSLKGAVRLAIIWHG